jgi:hypothetical protein
MTKLMQHGRWRLCQKEPRTWTGPWQHGDRYIILHYCEDKPDRLKNFGADGEPLKQSYSWVIDLFGTAKCAGCHRQPPAELTGFFSMLEWER